MNLFHQNLAPGLIKKQKNGNVHHYVYYHCSRKSKAVKCKEPCIRQEVLDKQISSLLQKAVLLSEKKTLEEKMARIEQKQNDWLEPRLGQPGGAAHPPPKRKIRQIFERWIF